MSEIEKLQKQINLLSEFAKATSQQVQSLGIALAELTVCSAAVMALLETRGIITLDQYRQMKELVSKSFPQMPAAPSAGE